MNLNPHTVHTQYFFRLSWYILKAKRKIRQVSMPCYNTYNTRGDCLFCFCFPSILSYSFPFFMESGFLAPEREQKAGTYNPLIFLPLNGPPSCLYTHSLRM